MTEKNIKKAVQTIKSQDEEDIIESYLKDISRIPLLSRQDEENMAREAARGDKTARDRLIRANLRFVVNVAKKYQGRGLPFIDLISEGNIGLMRAIEHFDVDRGFHFISYAVYWIRQSILMAIAEKSRIIRVPVCWNTKLTNIERARQALWENQNTGREIDKIASHTGLDSENVKQLVMLGQEVVSLEQPIHDDDSSSNSLGDLLESQEQESPEEYALKITLLEEIEKVLKTLNAREANVIRARFGLGNHRPMSLEEIGAHYHISKEGVRQIESKALKRLRLPGKCSRLESYA